MVSIVIPAYNATQYLKETVHSVLNQTTADWELLIVNDGSKDQTLSLAYEIARDNPRISVIDKPNGGVSSARNRGIKHAKGEFLAFLDADDVWGPSFLEECLHALHSDQTLGLVHSDLVIVDGQSQLTGKSKEGKSGQLLDDLLAWEGHVMSPPSGIMLRKSVLDEIGGFDENLSNNADQDFYIRCAAKYAIGRVARPLLKYRIHGQNMHGNIQVLERDSLFVFHKASRNKLFKNDCFEKKCFSNMYLIIAINYLRHQNNRIKFLKYLFRSILSYPPVLFRILKKI